MTHRLFWTGALSLSLALFSPGEAAVYRCAGADGIPSYQGVPCAGAEAAPLQLEPLNTLGDGLRQSERRWLQQRLREAQVPALRRRGDSASQEQRRQAERCLRERQRRDAVQAKLRRGYQPAQGERLRRRRDQHGEYLRRFCD